MVNRAHDCFLSPSAGRPYTHLVRGGGVRAGKGAGSLTCQDIRIGLCPVYTDNLYLEKVSQ